MRNGGPDGRSSASLRSLCSQYSVPAGAGTAVSSPAKAMPPATTLASDSVFSCRPLALIDRSTPLAFQNRDFSVTKRS